MTDLEIYSAYLPYEVKFEYTYRENDKGIWTLDQYNIGKFPIDERTKLILRPLSDLIKDEFALKLIDFLIDEGIYKSQYAKGFDAYDYKIIKKPFGKVIKFSNHDDWIFYLSINEPDRIKHKIYRWLLKNHFDVFGLIEQGKAININEL